MGLLSAHDYNEYKTFKLPVFGGTVPILFDEDLFSVDVAFSSGLSTEEIKPLSWDESRVLVLSEGRLHFVGRQNYIALFGGVICPYCQAMVYFLAFPHFLIQPDFSLPSIPSFFYAWPSSVAHNKR